ncbi:hypothetical protein FOZ63_004010, partial [Perkinsus olseni]
GYPPYWHSALSEEDGAYCGYSNGESGQADWRGLQFEAAPNAKLKTKFIVCPEQGDRDAFTSDFCGAQRTLWEYRRNYTHSEEKWRFEGLPKGTGANPLDDVDGWTLHEKLDAPTAAVGKLKMKSEKSLMRLVNQLVENTCAEALEILKEEYPTFEDLCKKHRDTSERRKLCLLPPTKLGSSKKCGIEDNIISEFARQ